MKTIDKKRTLNCMVRDAHPVPWQCFLHNSSPPVSSEPFPVPPPLPPVFLGVSARGGKVSGRYIEVCMQGKYRGRFACTQGIYLLCPFEARSSGTPQSTKIRDVLLINKTTIDTVVRPSILLLPTALLIAPPRECIIGPGRDRVSRETCSETEHRSASKNTGPPAEAEIRHARYVTLRQTQKQLSSNATELTTSGSGGGGGVLHCCTRALILLIVSM